MGYTMMLVIFSNGLIYTVKVVSKKVHGDDGSDQILQ